MAMDMDSGELHIISGWSNDEDDDKNNGGREKVGSLAATSPYTDKLIFFNV